MASRIEPRKVGLLAILLVALVVVIVVRVRPALQGTMLGDTGKLPQISSYNVPALAWQRESPRAFPDDQASRNLFVFGPPPTPTPDRRPTPTPPPTLPPRIQPTPTPPGIMTSVGRLPDPPRFTGTYLGWLGPDRLPVAVFRDGEDIFAVPVGETFKNNFVVKRVDPTTVVIGYVGYPDDVTMQMPLAR